MKVLCIGDIMLDVVALLETPINYASDTRSKISLHGGGAAANVASWLAHAGCSVHLIARVGDDAAGLMVISEIESFGVEHSHSVVAGASTGTVVVLVDQSGERTMFNDWGANSGLGVGDLPDLKEVSFCYLSGYPLINPASRPGALAIVEHLKAAGIPVLFDPASVGVLREVGLETVRSWLEKMDLLMLNAEEALFISQVEHLDEALEILAALTPVVIIKEGDQGALGKAANSPAIRVPAQPAHLVDSTGAGDAFAAGFIAAWLVHRELREAMLAATKTAAACVSVIGARPLVATEEQR